MQPRWYQTESVDAVWNHLRTEKGSPLVVLPTGAGKSLVLAMLAQQARQWSGRTIVLAHRKELLKQNAEKIKILMPGMDVGIYSAGLKRRDVLHDVICAGIQSVYNKAFEFGRRDVVVIDEAHLIPEEGDGMYQQFLRDLAAACPHARPIGLTATPFRCGTGSLSGPGKMFRKVCYEVGTGQLIAEGFLCNLTNKPSTLHIDTDQIKMRGGEFLNSSMNGVFEAETMEACKEIVEKTVDRNSVLVFCSGVKHAEAACELLARYTGETCEIVTGETPAMFRQSILERFSRGEIKYLCNCDVLTTGFDAPRIDCVAILRATMSPGLFAQIVGRGLRKHPSKTDCLVLDFGNNIKRHGSLDDADFGHAAIDADGSSKADENGRGKQCPNCEEFLPPATKTCDYCGFLFPKKVQDGTLHDTEADTESQLLGRTPPATWNVTGVHCNLHQKKNDPDAPPTLRVTYTCVSLESEPMTEAEAEVFYEFNMPTFGTCDDCGTTYGEVELTPDSIHYAKYNCGSCGRYKKFLPHPFNVGDLAEKTFSEWVCIEHAPGFARMKAESWWRERSSKECPIPTSVVEAEVLWPALRHPRQITVMKDGRWDRITQYVFDEEASDDWEALVFANDDDEAPF
jgi:DNA repair protein RadD